MTPRAIFFDLDDTLLVSAYSWAPIEQTCELLAVNRPYLNAQALLAANKEVWLSYWPAMERDWTLGIGGFDGAALSMEAWRRTLSTCGVVDDEALLQLAFETHAGYADKERRLFDDVSGMLGTLYGRLPLGLITNGASDTQRGKLRALDIESQFAAFGISGELGIAKPDAAIFHHALDALGVRPEDAWHVGDSLATDVAGAKAAGLTAVWLNRRGLQRNENDPMPDYEIASLTELPRLIEGGFIVETP